MRWIRRALAVIVGLPVLGVVALLVAGQREAAGKNVARVEIERPRAEVFNHIEDLERLRRWTGMAEVERLTPPPLQKGSRFRAASVRRGERTEMLSEVTAFERNDSIAFESRSAEGAPTPFAQSALYRFEGDDGRCRLTLTVRTRFDGWLLTLLEPLIAPAAQKELERLLRALKAQVESEAGSAAASQRSPQPGRERP